MKKRLLALALCALTVFSAAPLFAFVGTAEEGGEAPAYDYDALYVQAGLGFQYDLFGMNEFWDPEGDDHSTPASVYDLKDEGGALLFDTVEERVDQVYDGEKLLSVTALPAFKTALEAQIRQWGGLIDGFRVSGSMGLTLNMPVLGIESYRDQTGGYQKAAIALGRGYFQLIPDIHSHAYVNLNGSSYSGLSTVTYVAAPGTVTGKPHFYLYRGVSLGLAAVSGGYAFANNGNYNDVGYTVSGNAAVIDPDAVGDFTLEVKHPEVSGSTAAEHLADRKNKRGTLSVRYGITEMFTSSLSYGSGSSDTACATSIIGFQKATDQKLYAIRVYGRSLTNDELAMNHFADLAKYYKLDVGSYEKLTDSEKASVANTFLSDTVGKDAAYRTELQARVTEGVDSVVYGALLLEDTVNVGRFDFTDLAKALRVDISGLRALPVEYRQAVYVAALGLVDKTAESVQEAIDVTILAVIEENFGDYVGQATLTYKDLYVKQDHLQVWVDFFAAREEDGYVYDRVSYQDEATQNLAASNRVTTQHTATSAQPYNMDTLFAKYRFRGGDESARKNAFFMVDIPAAGWAHTNIRQYGDGCLECGFNNSVGIYSPGPDSDVTYQIVAGLKNKEGGSNAAGELQLDGFRITFGVGGQGPNMTSLTYFGFGPSSSPYSLTLSPNNTATLGYGKTRFFNGMTYSADITMVVDKKNNANKTYTIGYYTDEEGNLAYTAKAESIPEEATLEKDGAHYIYRKTAAAKLYIDLQSGSLYWLKGTAKNTYFFLVDKGNGEYAFCDGNQNEWMTTDETSFDKEAKTATAVTADSAPISLRGPYYDRGTIREVMEGTPGSYGPYSMRMMDVSAYTNGSLLFKGENLTYKNDQPGSVGNRANLTLYAIRTYDCVLTEEEIRQNHFADLAGYYGFDLSLYHTLTEAEKQELFDRLASMQLGDSRLVCLETYRTVLSSMIYDFESDSPAARSFAKVCKAYFLDVTSLMKLSAPSRERVFATFSDVNAEDKHYTAILQARLEEAVEGELLAHFEEATIHQTLEFINWELHVYGTPGMRATFALNARQLSVFGQRGAEVTVGVMVAEKGAGEGSFSSPDALRVSVDGNGALIYPDGVVPILAYENGQYTEHIWQEGEDLFFAEEIFPAEADYAQEYYCVAFVVLEKDGEIYTHYQVAAHRKDEAISLGELSDRALADNWAYPNIHSVLSSYLAEEGYGKVPLYIGNNLISDFVISPEVTNAELLEGVNSLLEYYVGISLPKGNGEGPLVHIGKFDTTYGPRCYGVSIHYGELYLWYNDEGDANLLVDLLDEIFAYYYNNGSEILLPGGLNVVRNAAE